MATRTRTTWKPRADGQFDSRLGWKLNENGKRVQHRFRIGSDLKEAKRRDHLLRQLWDRIEELQDDPLWSADTLETAKQVAQGRSHVLIDRATGEDDVAYATRVHRLSRAFPMIAFTTQPEYGVAFGVRLLAAIDRVYEGAAEAVSKEQAERGSLIWDLIQDPSLPMDGPTLHQAMRAYEDWIATEYAHPTEEITRWGRTQRRQMESLRNHHENLPLSQLDRANVEAMHQYWRQRPLRKGSKDQRVTAKTAANLLKTLRRFLKWLHANERFNWRRPEHLNEISTTIVVLEGERRAQITANEIFTLDELTTLYAYGQPLDRLLLLLGLNCGFATAEAATLLVEEIHFRSSHTPRQCEILKYESTAEQSFIKRFRRKNRVYGEFLLWDHTVKGLEWAIGERRQHTDFGPHARVLLNGKGKPFDALTKSGNQSQQIPNLFARLKKRIKDQHKSVSDLPFKMLRKTGGDLVKSFSDGETMGVFHCRGRVDEARDDLADVYATRKFGKVFSALEQVERHLGPMFVAAGPEPFTSQPQSYTPRSTIQRVLQLHSEGYAPSHIAEVVDLSLSTVQRHIKRATGPRRPGRPKKK